MNTFSLEEMTTFNKTSRSALSSVIATQPVEETRLPLIAAIITKSTESLFSDLDLSKLMTDLTSACQLNRSLCVLYLLTKTEVPITLRAPQVDGAIVIGRETDRVVQQLQARQLPLIAIDHYRPEDRIDLVAKIQHLLRLRSS